jgi:ABC-2 type transport system ATP-binding protein
MKPLLLARNLGFGPPSKPRLDAVDLQIDRGECVGLLGTNGAGKTTLIRLLAGVCSPKVGEVRLQGTLLQEAPPALRRLIGYLPQRVAAYRELTVKENLRWAGRLHGIRKPGLEGAIRRTCEQLELTDVRNRLAGQLSAGMLQRLGLAQAILHTPEILILDEPTAGLDPLQIDAIRGLLRHLAAQASVIIATHLLDDVSDLCNRVVLLDAGRKSLEQTITADSDLLALFRAPNQPNTETLSG